MIGENALKHLHIIEWNGDDVLDVLVENAGISDVQHPRVHTVISSDEFDDFLPSRRSSGSKHREVRHVAAILGEHRPVRAIDCVDE